MTPDMTETVKIPGRLFKLDWVEDGFSVRVNDPLVGKVDLAIVAGEAAQSFIIDIPAMKHSFKAVGCDFGSN